MKVNQEQAQAIIDRYVSGERSKALAEKYGVCPAAIILILNGVNHKKCHRPENIKEILTRNKSPGKPLKQLPFEPTKRQKEIIDGSLLGDGSIPKNANNCHFAKPQNKERKEYLEWHFRELMPYSARLTDDYRNTKIQMIDNQITHVTTEKYLASHTFQTYAAPYFTDLRKKWYPNNIKIVPKDINLSPLTIAIWFCDDGSNHSKYRIAQFATNSFEVNDVNFLRDKLFEHFRINTTINYDKGLPRIRTNSKSYDILIDIIKPYIVWNCFQYKLEKRALDRPIAVRCIETGETFKSIAEVYKQKKISHFLVKKAILNKTTSCGFHWERYKV